MPKALNLGTTQKGKEVSLIWLSSYGSISVIRVRVACLNAIALEDMSSSNLRDSQTSRMGFIFELGFLATDYLPEDVAAN